MKRHRFAAALRLPSWLVKMMQLSLVGCTIEMPILTGSDNEKHMAHHLHQVEGEAYLAGRSAASKGQNMTNTQVDLNQFIVGILEGSVRRIKLTTEDLTDEQLYYQPTADANSMAWLIWHLSRWKDHVSALVSGEPQVWVSEGWAQRWGLPSERTGVGDTPEQVAAFRVARQELFGYLDAAHRATVERVAKLTPEQLAQPTEDLPGDNHPAWQALRRVCGDSQQHTGQINYIRGLLSGYGWTRHAGGLP